MSKAEADPSASASIDLSFLQLTFCIIVPIRVVPELMCRLPITPKKWAQSRYIVREWWWISKLSRNFLPSLRASSPVQVISYHRPFSHRLDSLSLAIENGGRDGCLELTGWVVDPNHHPISPIAQRSILSESILSLSFFHFTYYEKSIRKPRKLRRWRNRQALSCSLDLGEGKSLMRWCFAKWKKNIQNLWRNFLLRIWRIKDHKLN